MNVCVSMCACFQEDTGRQRGPGDSQEEPKHQSKQRAHTQKTTDKHMRELEGDFSYN